MPNEEQSVYRKSFTGVILKADKPGYFRARIATLNVIDKDGDVTLPGAYPNGKEILISAYQHGSWEGALPVGKGVILEEGNEVFVDGLFNLATTSGKDTYEAVKFAPQLIEWSEGFIIKALDEESEWADNPEVWRVLKTLDVIEASPVLRGAGVNTATLAVKSETNGRTLADEGEAALAAVSGFVARVKALGALRRGEGKAAISESTTERMRRMMSLMGGMMRDMQDMMDEMDGEDGKAEREAVQKALLTWLRTKHQLQISEVK